MYIYICIYIYICVCKATEYTRFMKTLGWPRAPPPDNVKRKLLVRKGFVLLNVSETERKIFHSNRHPNRTSINTLTTIADSLASLD